MRCKNMSEYLVVKMNCSIFLKALKRERLPSSSSPAFFVLFSVSLSFDLTTHLSFWSVSATTNPSSSLPIIFHISAFPRPTLPIQLVLAYLASGPSSPHLFATTIIPLSPYLWPAVAVASTSISVYSYLVLWVRSWGKKVPYLWAKPCWGGACRYEMWGHG